MKAKELDLTAVGKEQMIPAFPGMPFTCYTNIFSAVTYDYIDWHWHSEIQYCIVLKGSVLFRVGEHSYSVESGQGILIPAGLAHMSRPTSSQPSGYFCLDIDLNKLLFSVPGLSDKEKDSGTAGQTMLLYQQQDRELLHSINSLREKYQMPQEDSALLLYSELFRLWHITMRRMIGPTLENAERQHNERLIKILSFIQQHYMEKISLEQVAQQVHLSSSECCRFFKQTLGQTIFEYLQQYRIQKSKELLRQSQMTIAEIAYAVGFNSQSYFTSIFRKETGITPTEYSWRGF